MNLFFFFLFLFFVYLFHWSYIIELSKMVILDSRFTMVSMVLSLKKVLDCVLSRRIKFPKSRRCFSHSFLFVSVCVCVCVFVW